jgi:excisionase family DNA binding protein
MERNVMTSDLINENPGFKPYIEGTRLDVQFIVEYHEHFKWPAEKIAYAFRLTLAQVHAALSYYHEHKEAIDRAIAEDAEKDADLIPGVPYYGSTESVLMLVMTPQEVSEQYGISVEAVYQAIRRKRLPARQSGKTWLVLRSGAERLWGHRTAA